MNNSHTVLITSIVFCFICLFINCNYADDIFSSRTTGAVKSLVEKSSGDTLPTVKSVFNKVPEDSLVKPSKVATPVLNKPESLEMLTMKPKLSGGYKADVEPTTQEGRNRWHFQKTTFKRILKSECNLKIAFCHNDPDDPGKETCCGVSKVYNPNFFIDNINNFFRNCRPHPGGKYHLCKFTPLIKQVEDLYLSDKYAKGFRKCPTKSWDILIDNSMWNGRETTVRNLQRSHGLKADGIFGPKTLNACENFSIDAFINERFRYLKTRKTWKKYHNGFTNRLNGQLKRYKESSYE